MLVKVTQDFAYAFGIKVPVGFKLKAEDIRNDRLVYVSANQLSLIGVPSHSCYVDADGLVAVHVVYLEPC